MAAKFPCTNVLIALGCPAVYSCKQHTIEGVEILIKKNIPVNVLNLDGDEECLKCVAENNELLEVN